MSASLRHKGFVAVEGVWCSTDDGATFAAANAGLPAGDIPGLVRDGTRYYALTGSDGVFASDAATAGAPRPADGALSLTISPNPSAGATELVMDLPRASAAAVDVFDAVGRRAARLHDGPLAAGRHAFMLDARALPPGVYLVRVTAGADVMTRRLVSVR